MCGALGRTCIHFYRLQGDYITVYVSRAIKLLVDMVGIEPTKPMATDLQSACFSKNGTSIIKLWRLYGESNPGLMIDNHRYYHYMIEPYKRTSKTTFRYSTYRSHINFGLTNGL